eukprot:12532318-Alexandrium_andersonii.AAC.1
MSNAVTQQPQLGLFSGATPAPRPPLASTAGVSPELGARSLQSTFEDLRSGGPEWRRPQASDNRSQAGGVDPAGNVRGLQHETPRPSVAAP